MMLAVAILLDPKKRQLVQRLASKAWNDLAQEQVHGVAIETARVCDDDDDDDDDSSHENVTNENQTTNICSTLETETIVTTTH